MGRSVYLSDEDQNVLRNLVGNWMIWLDENESQFGDEFDREERARHEHQKQQSIRLYGKLAG